MDEQTFWKRVMEAMIARGTVPTIAAEADPEGLSFRQTFMDLMIKRLTAGEDIRPHLGYLGVACSAVDPVGGRARWLAVLSELTTKANILDAAPDN